MNRKAEQQDHREGTERRQSKRAAVDYDLESEVSGHGAAFYTGLIKNISTGGVFIATDRRHRLQELLRIRFLCPGSLEPVEVLAQVQWICDSQTSGGSQPGIGVRFLDLPSRIAKQIDEHIADRDTLFFEE